VKIEYLHASKYGNGATVAEEFSKQMAARAVTVDVHHISAVSPKEQRMTFATGQVWIVLAYP
jgi:menaquinone-dependent protoporphyrinogen IX oxidase